MTHPPHRPRDEGAATTQLVLVVPAVLVLMLLTVQFALAWHAQHIAQYAAERGLAAARLQHATQAAGHEQARSSIHGLGSHVLTTPAISVHRGEKHVTVSVRGSVMPVVPGINLPATGTASGPVERLTNSDGGTP
ncbi:TadE/TadG family type IV pilus assembly protein [Streptomyces chengbuensis]|uniref:TadE/TadG family type IV pilus assembly protein n=1 Tax=Streptomyces chengbuensis TaxID=3053466 RepID=UPI0025B33E3C|nr:TadE/TadG family type IV pilus assembly protein [Streptomyces sp. HUAS CB01]WJY53539.1 TadE/TadG family type IV pilus assembly protein [Streptomyces sp. HUAS CB01]